MSETENSPYLVTKKVADKMEIIGYFAPRSSMRAFDSLSLANVLSEDRDYVYRYVFDTLYENKRIPISDDDLVKIVNEALKKTSPERSEESYREIELPSCCDNCMHESETCDDIIGCDLTGKTISANGYCSEHLEYQRNYKG